jgi:hypothetical protein
VVLIHVHFVTMNMIATGWSIVWHPDFFLFGITQILICSGRELWWVIAVQWVPELELTLSFSVDCHFCVVSNYLKVAGWKSSLILGLSSLSKVCHPKVDKPEHTEDMQTLPGISCKTDTYKETVVWTLKTVLHQWCAWRICSGCRSPLPLPPL